MAYKVLPTVNFDANPGLDEFQYLHETYSQEFRYRSQISSVYGIVDVSQDPASAPFNAGRPLLVTVSAINPQTIDIAPGFAITPSNLMVHLDSSVTSVPLPNLGADKVFVVAAEYTLVSSEQQRINRFGTLTEVRLERPSNTPPGGGASTLLSAVTIADLNDFNNLSIFPQERLDNIVVLAVITVRSDPITGQLLLNIDSSRENYSFNRPWFSIRDIEHRSKIGSGVVSDNNPHGTELQDLSSAGLTLYQQLKPYGGVISKDLSYFGYPGVLCSETITLSRIEADYSGVVTTPDGRPRLGGSYFVRLLKRPVRVGSLYFAGKPWQPVPYRWVPGTNILILGSLEQPLSFGTEDLIFEYFAVDALEVNTESLTQGVQTITVKNPLPNQEFIISGGLAIDTLAQTTLQLPSLLGPIKKKYQMLCDGAGALLLAPQPLVAFTRVQDLFGASALQINQTPAGGKAVPIIIGLTRAIERTIVGATVFDLDVRIRISGLSAENTALTEDIVFKAAQWKDQNAVLNIEEPLQFRTTKNKFLVVNSIILTNTSQEPPNAGPDALISLWADSLSSTANRELATVASFFWTGVTAIQVRDERQIATTLQKIDQKQSRLPFAVPENDLAATQELLSVILNPPLTRPDRPTLLKMVELNDDRYYSETWKDFSSTDAKGVILVSTFAAVTIGQTVRIAPGKYLKIVESGANPEIGEVNIGNSDIVFKNNIIATINDPTFDSTWFATLGTGTNPAINLSRPQAYPEGFVLNARKSITLTREYTGSLSFSVEGVAVSLSNQLITLSAIKNAIEAVKETTGVGAVLSQGASPVVILNGLRDGQAFTVTEPLVTEANPPNSERAVYLTQPLEAFSLTSPVGGVLPTPHLPQRYPTSGVRWEYLGRPYLWEGTSIEAKVAIKDDNTSSITSGDQLQIAPGKVLTAKRIVTGQTIDPNQGDFFVDASLANTLENMVATINNEVWNSGVRARLDPNDATKIILQIGGFSNADLLVVTQTIQGVFEIENYTPVGAGHGESHGFIKTLRPIATAKWRFLIVPSPGAAMRWSSWTDLLRHSPTSFSFRPPVGQSLYALQLHLVGETFEPNGFSLYQFRPQINEVDVVAIGTRLTEAEETLTEAVATQGSLSETLNFVGSEVTEALTGSIFGHPAPASLKERLDATDMLCQWLTGGLSNASKPSLLTSIPGQPNQLLMGPVDGNGNSEHIISATNAVLVGGTTSSPLAFSIKGYHYIFRRRMSIALTDLAAGTYYVKAEVGSGDELGLQMATGTLSVSAVKGSDTLTDSTKNFTALGIEAGHVVEIPAVTLLGKSLFVLVRSVTTTTLVLEGYLPEALSLGSTYKVWSTRELGFSLVSSKSQTSSNLYLGEIVWTGSGITKIRNYRYLDQYDSGIVGPVSASPNYQTEFEHNLGFLPKRFTIYFHTSASGDTDPKVLNLGDEVVVKSSKTTMTVRNRYQNQVCKSYDGTVKTTGYIQLVIG